MVLFYLCIRSGLLPVPPPGVEYKDLITIILTAVAVLLAAVTVIIALLAFWGYNSIRESAEKVAKETAERVAARTAEPVAARVALQVAERARGVPPPNDGVTSALAEGPTGGATS